MVLLTFSDLLQLIFECGMGVKRMSLKQFDIQGLLIDYALNNRNSLLQVLHICTKMCFPLIIYIFILKPRRCDVLVDAFISFPVSSKSVQ